MCPGHNLFYQGCSCFKSLKVCLHTGYGQKPPSPILKWHCGKRPLINFTHSTPPPPLPWTLRLHDNKNVFIINDIILGCTHKLCLSTVKCLIRRTLYFLNHDSYSYVYARKVTLEIKHNEEFFLDFALLFVCLLVLYITLYRKNMHI